jgi:hypothetical protein
MFHVFFLQWKILVLVDSLEKKNPSCLTPWQTIYMCGSFSFDQRFISESLKRFPTMNRSKPTPGEKLGKLMFHALASASPLTDIRLVEQSIQGYW